MNFYFSKTTLTTYDTRETYIRPTRSLSFSDLRTASFFVCNLCRLPTSSNLTQKLMLRWLVVHGSHLVMVSTILSCSGLGPPKATPHQCILLYSFLFFFFFFHPCINNLTSITTFITHHKRKAMFSYLNPT